MVLARGLGSLLSSHSFPCDPAAPVGICRYRVATGGKRTAGSPKTQYPLAS